MVLEDADTSWASERMKKIIKMDYHTKKLIE